MIYLAFGSNLSSKFGSPQQTIIKAYSELRKYGIKIKKKSSFYRSKAFPNPEDPEFINSIISFESKLSPENLLKIIFKVENKFERIRRKINEPRTLDIDIIDYNSKIFSFKNGNLDLKIPHQHLKKRLFVLYPLQEINPFWQFPVNGKKIGLIISENKISENNMITKL